MLLLSNRLFHSFSYSFVMCLLVRLLIEYQFEYDFLGYRVMSFLNYSEMTMYFALFFYLNLGMLSLNLGKSKVLVIVVAIEDSVG